MSWSFSMMAMKPRQFVKISMSVHRRDDKADLEFARQIRFAVKRINKVFIFRRFVVELHAVNPDGVIRLGLRRECQRNLVRVGNHLFARLSYKRAWVRP